MKKKSNKETGPSYENEDGVESQEEKLKKKWLKMRNEKKIKKEVE